MDNAMEVKMNAKQIPLYQHGTGVVLAKILAKDLNAWCDAYGYLPHHKAAGGWVVIAQ